MPLTPVPSRIDFYGLARPIQDRFAAATRRTAPPAPLLYHRASRSTAWALLVGSVVLLVAEAALLSAGFGHVDSGLSLHGPAVIGVDVVLLGGAAYCILHAVGILLALESRPWRPGVYLFPACVVDARHPSFLVWPMGDAESIERVTTPGPGLSFRMRGGARVVVPAVTLQAAQQAEEALEPLRRELSRALEAGDHHALAELDPLHDLAMSSPIGPTAKMRPNVALWMRVDWALAAVLGVVLGHALATTRNTLSDDAMYRTVAAAGDVVSYRAYLERAGAHAPDVREVLLPRAELHQAEAVGTVEAIQAFAQAHPSTRIGLEIDAALRRATLAELEKAKRAGTVTAIDAFALKYPDHGVDAEIHAARHALFVRALAAWRAQSHPDPSTNAFVERLLGWAEKAGSGKACEVRFRGKPSTSIDDADKSVMTSGHYPGPDALPSHYVAPAALRPREERVENAIAAGFAAAFPSEILTVRAGAALEPDASPPAETPTLVVEYSPEWSHGNTASGKPNTVFAGLIFTFDAGFALPEGAPWKVTVKAWRGAEAWKVKGENLAREDFEQKVYDAMIDGAFDQLQKKVLDVFF
jgi:hypothetical protein